MHYTNTKTILSNKNGMNLYRGCTHGCIYCDSRSEIYNMQHEFEDIEVKKNSIELLKKRLKNKKEKCMIGTGSMTDPYIPIESQLQYLRKSLELIYKYGYGFTCITKSDLILRDIDLLKKINEKTKTVIQVSLTSYNKELSKIIEPNVCTSERRYEVLKKLNKEGIPTIVWLCPILPYITNTEENINGIIDYCINANVKGIICFGMGMTLRKGNKEYYYKNLDKYFPGLKEKYIEKYGDKYQILSPNNDKLMKILNKRCNENNITTNIDEIFKYLHEFPKQTTQAKLI